MESLVGLLARCRSPGFASLSGRHLLAFSELAFGRGRGRYYISRARPHPRPWQMGFLFSLAIRTLLAQVRTLVLSLPDGSADTAQNVLA